MNALTIAMDSNWITWTLLSAVIVGQRWPSPRWFLGPGSGPPPGSDFVIADSDDVFADIFQVIAFS